MAIFTAVQNGDMDTPATFGGGGTPGNTDEIALGGYTVSCSSDKRTLANGITISGTGKLLILSGGAFKTAVDIPSTCTVQFGEPTGVGAGPLPAHGALDANASGEIIFSTVHKRICGPCEIWTARRTGKGWARVANRVSYTESVLDDDSTDWRSGDVVVSMGPTPSIYECAVSAWDAGTASLSHASMSSSSNAEGVVLARASCAAHVRRTINSGYELLAGGLIGDGDLYLFSAGFNSGILGDYNLDGRLVITQPLYESGGHADELIAAFQIGKNSLYGLSANGGVAKAIQLGNTPTKATLSNYCITDSITPPSIGYNFDITLIDCDLPTPLVSGALATNQSIRVLNAASTSDVLHTAGGLATKVQHADLPGTNDLPDAYLLAPVSGRAYIDYLISVKRGQTVRLRYHTWLGGETAGCGYDIYDADRQVPGLEPPLQSFALPEGCDILEWHRPTPAIYHNDSERDMVLRVRAWADSDNVYIRCSPERGGGAL